MELRHTLKTYKGYTAHLSVNHVRDHHNLVAFRVWKFQRKFGGLYVESQNNRILKNKKQSIELPPNVILN